MTKTVSLAECPVGLFIAGSGTLCLKTEYSNDNGSIIAYVASSGEAFWGGAQTASEQRLVQVSPIPDPVAVFCTELAAEIERAATKHPGPNPNLAALTEEVGELAEALLDARKSQLHGGCIRAFEWQCIREEAVQVATMAFRVAFEGDPSLSVVPEDAPADAEWE